MLTLQLRENPLHKTLPPNVYRWVDQSDFDEMPFRKLIAARLRSDMSIFRILPPEELRTAPPAVQQWLVRVSSWLPEPIREWWSGNLSSEQFTDERSATDLLINLTAAVIAYDGDSMVGAAGLTPSLGPNSARGFEGDQRVVAWEITAAYTDPLHRGRGSATSMFRQLLEYADEHCLKVTIVPNNPSVERLAQHFGGFRADSIRDRDILCYCYQWDTSCSFCPRNGKVWRFPYPAVRA